MRFKRLLPLDLRPRVFFVKVLDNDPRPMLLLVVIGLGDTFLSFSLFFWCFLVFLLIFFSFGGFMRPSCRSHVRKSKSARSFRKASGRTSARNLRGPMRGGLRI